MGMDIRNTRAASKNKTSEKTVHLSFGMTGRLGIHHFFLLVRGQKMCFSIDHVSRLSVSFSFYAYP